jgi:hypothetical protein
MSLLGAFEAAAGAAPAPPSAPSSGSLLAAFSAAGAPSAALATAAAATPPSAFAAAPHGSALAAACFAAAFLALAPAAAGSLGYTKFKTYILLLASVLFRGVGLALHSAAIRQQDPNLEAGYHALRAAGFGMAIGVMALFFVSWWVGVGRRARGAAGRPVCRHATRNFLPWAALHAPMTQRPCFEGRGGGSAGPARPPCSSRVKPRPRARVRASTPPARAQRWHRGAAARGSRPGLRPRLNAPAPAAPPGSRTARRGRSRVAAGSPGSAPSSQS